MTDSRCVVWIMLQSLTVDEVHLRRLSRCCGCRKVERAWVKVFGFETFESAMKSASIFLERACAWTLEIRASLTCHRWQLITCHHFPFSSLSTDYSSSRRYLDSASAFRYTSPNNSTSTMSASFAPDCNQVKEYVDTIRYGSYRTY
jgi:hypothetical protein